MEQLAAHLLALQEVTGSSPVTATNKPLKIVSEAPVLVK